ncbi:MAG: hypothetical protein JKY22_00975 [Flavobacteriaceae bacterium]|nr:hypothetical protein [Flavobacteriaceae bacterium]
MNKRTKYIFVALRGQELVLADTNLTSFVRGIKAIEPSVDCRTTFENKFKEETRFYHVTGLGVTYSFHKYVNPSNA